MRVAKRTHVATPAVDLNRWHAEGYVEKMTIGKRPVTIKTAYKYRGPYRLCNVWCHEALEILLDFTYARSTKKRHVPCTERSVQSHIPTDLWQWRTLGTERPQSHKPHNILKYIKIKPHLRGTSWDAEWIFKQASTWWFHCHFSWIYLEIKPLLQDPIQMMHDIRPNVMLQTKNFNEVVKKFSLNRDIFRTTIENI